MVYVDRRGLFMNGKAEAASGAPTCEKRVNTFSFCGTGGSFEKNAANFNLRRSLFYPRFSQNIYYKQERPII